jgi:hypothetical protein
MPDYIPSKDSELAPWASNFTKKVSANSTAWDIPAAEIGALQVANVEFARLQGEADSPDRTSVIVEERNESRQRLVALIRAMVGFRLQNPVITDYERIGLGLHVHDTKPTSIPVPSTRPELDIDVVDFRRLKVLFHDMGSESRAKPYGVNGAVILYALLDAPPAGITALGRSALATRTPYILEFTEEERGKTVYIAMCWQNKKGERGPWSEIESAIVP